MKNKPGYVLVLTLMVIALAIALLTTVMQRSFIFQDTILVQVQREKAKMLALGGLQVAMAQLALIIPQEKKPTEQQRSKPGNKAPEKKPELTPEQQWLLKLLSVINSWQKFPVKEDKEGIEGTLQLYIASEQGKLSINSLIADSSTAPPLRQGFAGQAGMNGDAKNQDKPKQSTGTTATKPPEKKDFGKLIQEMLSQKSMGNLLDVLRTRNKSLGRPLIDVTELLSPNDLQEFKNKIFITPESSPKDVYLMDLFTVDNSLNKINPWLLSNSLVSLLGFRPVALAKEGENKVDIKELVKKSKPSAAWSNEWNTILAPIYGKQFSAISPEISGLFARQFEANVFSVISYAQVGAVTQKICGIIEKAETPAGLSSKSVTFKLKRLYWL